MRSNEISCDRYPESSDLEQWKHLRVWRRKCSWSIRTAFVPQPYDMNHVDNRARLTAVMDWTFVSVQTVDTTTLEWFHRIGHTTRMVSRRVADAISSLWPRWVPILPLQKICRFSSMFYFAPSAAMFNSLDDVVSFLFGSISYSQANNEV